MNTKIYYFSGTGNSFAIAKDLAAALGHTQIISIPKVINSEIDLKADRIGLVFPVYAWGPPNIVVNFINKLVPEKRDAYYFTIATYGGFPGATLVTTKKLLQDRGIKQSLGAGVRLPGNCITLYGAWQENKQRALFEKAKDRVRGIASLIKNKSEVLEKSPFFVNMFFSFVHKLFTKNMHLADKHFWINEKCINCGTCNKICPTANIKVEGNKRTWLHQCEQCMACIQWCPKEAIQFKNKTASKKRYHHYEVKAQDLFVR